MFTPAPAVGRFLVAAPGWLGRMPPMTEIRPVAHAPLRLKESRKLGFSQAWLPNGTIASDTAIKSVGFTRLSNLVDHMLGRG